MFALLGLHPGPDITAAAAASLAGIGRRRPTGRCEELAAASLLTEHLPGRYAFHDLLRAYAAEHAEALDPGAAARPSAGYWTTTCTPPTPPPCCSTRCVSRSASPRRHLASHRRPGRSPAGTGLVRSRAPGAARGRRAGRRDRLRCLRLAAVLGHGRPSSSSGRWHELGAIQRTGLAAATRLGDLAGQAALSRRLGGAYTFLGDYPRASAHLSECLELYGRLGDRDGQVTHPPGTLPSI